MKNQVITLKQGCIAFVVVILINLILVVPVFSQTIRPEKTVKAVYSDKSEKLRDVPVVSPTTRDRSWKDGVVKNKHGFHEEFKTPSFWTGSDPVLQDEMPSERSNPIIYNNFPGVGNVSGVAPPDPDGDVGPNHYFQMVNLAFAIWDKSGNILYGPADNSTLWDGFSGPWSGSNDGDPIIMYDEYADRWVASQFALPNYPNGPFYELVAVSETGDPTGAWYRYAFQFDNMPDYPKFGIWSDGYYFTINQFAPPYVSWAGAGVCVLDRAAMLTGNPNAEMIFFNLGTSYGSLLPADCDGPTLPPAGTSSYFAEIRTSSLLIWEADIDWNNTSNSSVTIASNLPVQSYSYSGITINQPNTTTTLMDITDRLMYRLQYRNFGSYQVMLTNHTVNANGSGQAGIRWYELRNYGSGWSVYQQGTYAPDDGENRWMASIAMNGDGDIALGYSVSSATTFPSIRFAGQNAESSGTGILDIPESSIKEGSASQTGINRWGDYSSMTVDPTDDQKFWYTAEYSNGGWNWKTQIASFSYAPIVDPPVADFSADDTHPMQGQTVQFMDQSTNVPCTWNWSFSPSTVSFVEGTTSGSKNPKVQFNGAGFYTVTLTATNDIGTDSEVKTNYINTLDCSPITIYPYLLTFDEWSESTPALSCTSDGTVQLDDCWTNATGDYLDWDILSGNTGSPSTGPNDDHGGGGNYAYTESSNCFNHDAFLESPAFNLSGISNPELRFWYHMYGSTMGTLAVQVSTNGGSTWSSNIWSLSGTQGDLWQEAVIPLGSYSTATNFKLRFVGLTGTSWYSDMAIDDISVDGGAVSGDDPPVADFSANNLTPTLEETVSFSDLSTNNPTSFTWSFSPGTITYIAGTSSSSQNPQVKFNAPGVYTVSLTVSNSGGSDTKTKTNYINVSILPPVADFSANNLTPTLEETVSFSDLSTNNPTSCTWSFSPGTITYMGGASSSSQNPQVKFNAPGAYTISLTVVNSGGTDTKTKINYITAEIPPPVAGFVADNTAPETNDIVNFTDISNNNPVSWAWVFNPATVTYMNGTNANSQNPEVRFNIEGYYDVQLTATNTSGSDTEFVADYIQCADPVLPPVADFFANNTSPAPGEIVNFIDVSTNTPTGWTWSFNPPSVTFVNGTTENSQNPQLSFNVAGTYDVTLTSTNSQGLDSEIKIAYIVAADLPAFGLPWSEDFEDVGNTETLTASSVSINGLPEWSYEKTANGRLRFTAGNGFYYSGNHAATVDASPSGSSYALNYLTTTLNLSGYATSANLELSFVYMHHGEESHTNDRVWMRGSSSDVWIEVFDLYSNKGTLGTWKTVTGIDIDALLGAHGQCPSSTFQLRFGQEDNYAASRTTASDGFTFDDIKVEEMEMGAYTINEFPYTQSWESGMGLWMQGSSDDFDWTRLNRGTPSSLTGPTGAQDGNYYLYTEASSPRVNGDEAHLEATFDFTTLPVPTLSFYYHMYGISIASLHVDVFDGSWHNSVWVANGPQQNTQSDPYEQAVIDLSAWGGEDNIVIRFRGIVGSGAASTFYSDIAIDMLEVVGGTVSEDPPVADFLADNTNPSMGELVTITDISTNSPTGWLWSFDPPSVTFVDGTSATSQNPKLIFEVAGAYDVTLTATNANGTDSEIKLAYITAFDLPVFSLPWVEDFEDIGSIETFAANTTTIDGLPEWAYEKTATGRLRFAAGNGFYNSGNHAATVDANPSGSNYAVNYIIATLDLSAYAQSADLELAFAFMHHGEESHVNDRVWIRGSSSDIWIEAFNLYSNRGTVGRWNTISGIDIDALLSANNQSPSFTFQVRFGQEDNYSAFRTTSSDGFTFDDIMVSGTIQSLQNVSTGSDEALNGAFMFDDESDMEKLIEVFPNPAKDQLNIVSASTERMEILIYSLTGQLVYYKDDVDNYELIDIINFDRGMYVVKIRTDGQVINKKIVKQ